MRLIDEDYLFSAEECRKLDQLMIEDLQISSFELMHRAAVATLELIKEKWPTIDSLQIMSGSGKNGGDGFLLAKLASQVGLDVEVFMTKPIEQLSDDVQKAAKICQAAGVLCRVWQNSYQLNGDLLVDALLGTGLSHDVRGVYGEVIDAINQTRYPKQPILSIDIPSGLHPDTGKIKYKAVQADVTITFIGAKRGLFTGDARNITGQVVYEPLGVTNKILDAIGSPVLWVSEKSLDRMKPRPKTAHKGQMGHVAVVGGEMGMGGAVILAAEAALNSGAGLVSVYTRESHVGPLLARLPEVMGKGVDDLGDPGPNLSQASVIVVGPGMGKTSWSLSLLKHVLKLPVPVVVDADAINLIAEKYTVWPDDGHAPRIITPHPKEAARLLGCTTEAVEQDRFDSVTRLTQDYHCTVLLKGPGTIVAGIPKIGKHAGQLTYDVIDTGNPGMATGGMGDVLAGLIGSLVGQGDDCFLMTGLAAWLHGRAADQLAHKRGAMVGLRATEVIKELSFS